MLKRLMEHPLTRGRSIDDPETTLLRREIIRSKGFLNRLYCEWYSRITDALPPPRTGVVLEIGAGAGFMKAAVPGILASEAFFLPDIDIVLDGIRLPVRSNSLDGIAMTDVLHHLRDPAGFLHEAYRCIRPGGRVVMLEPWVSHWSRWVYGNLHHEPFLPEAEQWRLPRAGPLSGANGAMPWMIFERDREKFCREFPGWEILTVEPMMPFSYLFSGGVSMRSLVPGLAYRPVRWLEGRFEPWIRRWAMFALIVLVKRKTALS